MNEVDSNLLIACYQLLDSVMMMIFFNLNDDLHASCVIYNDLYVIDVKINMMTNMMMMMTTATLM